MNSGVISGIRAVTLDVGGTLLEPFPGVGVSYATALRRRGLTADEAEIEKRFRIAFRQVQTERAAQMDESMARLAWREIVEQSISPWCPPEKVGEVFEELWEAFAQPDNWRPLRGVQNDLELLHQLGSVPMYVFSNWDSRLRRVLQALKWEKYFQGIFISSELGAAKPSRDAFARVQKILGLPAGAILHVGDSLEQDYEGALAAGWQAVLAYPKPAEAASCRSIQALNELPQYAPFGRT